MNPPRCARKATPPSPSGAISEDNSWIPNHNPSTHSAGSLTACRIKPSGTSTSTRARGNSSR